MNRRRVQTARKMPQGKELNMRKCGIFSGLLAGCAVFAASGTAAGTDWGSFDGVVIEAKLIGGQQYEGLYSRISEWEAATCPSRSEG